jgi:ribonucleotide reductase beta subunit family protein with ferritin-like domain
MIMRLLTISIALIVRRRKSRKKYDSKMLKKSKLKMLIFNFSYKDSVPSDSYSTFFACLFKANVRICITKYSLSCLL